MADITLSLSSARFLQPLTIGLTVGTILSLAHRLYVRVRLARTITGVDWTMLLTALLFIPVCGLSLTASKITLLSISTSTDYSHTADTLLKIATILYTLSSSTAKLSVGGWLPKSVAWTRPALNTALMLHVIFTFIADGMTLFPCGARLADNLAANCDATRLSTGFALAWASANAAVAAALLAVGVYEVYVDACSTPFAKLVFAGVAAIGAGSVAAAGARVILLLSPPSGAGPEAQKLLFAIAAVLEVGLAITAGCLLVVRPAFARWLGDGTVADPLLMARRGHGRVTMVEEGKGGAAGETRPNTGKSVVVSPKKQEVFEWKETVERRKKRQGVYVSQQELEGGLSPLGSPGEEKSIWLS